MNILRIDGSARFEGSVTRGLADQVIEGLRAAHPNATVTQRELSDPIPLLNETWINANFTDPAERSEEQRAALALSDELVAELKAADAIVLAAPIYNFGIPAAMKAWVDMVCRARETFRYTENGPVGLLEDRPVYLVTASGGTPIGSEIDFATGYLRHILGFIGITDVRVIEAGQLMAAAEPALERAREQIEKAVPAAA
ncbi:MAG: FMN-dependent NADH-azoreductase [Gammaproteobacteria bacterium]